MKILIAGGAGFIGSTIASACLDAGITPVILDNLATGRAEFVADRIFYRGDIADGDLIGKIFADHPDIEAAVHAAALIVVPESVEQPLRYYRENVAKSIELIEHLIRAGCRKLLFSSSASIYRPGDDFAVDETSPLEPLSPYARTKAVTETVLADAARAHDLRVISLRYFNPIGADPRMRTGLQLRHPTHVLGRMIIAAESGTTFTLTGADWPTRDGSGVRDYIHVWDLARAHVQALRRFDRVLPPDAPTRYRAVNVGTGTGVTVRELLAIFAEVTGRAIPTIEAGRRPGDSAGCFTRTDLVGELLDWCPTRSVADGIRDSLRWSALRDSILERPP
ncbi:MAG: UDP-glucose 4-epimerase [Micromonosporaceae bacterium]|nr:UDP-glucose 4-epimerase [Micromonosporaceae bacterium]